MLPDQSLSGARPALQIAGLSSNLSLSTLAHEQHVNGAPVAVQLEDSFYEQEFDPVRHTLAQIPDEGVDQNFIDFQVGQRMWQLDFLMERLSKQVMENHEEMVKGMQLVTELETDMQVSTIITKNGRRHLSSAMHEVSQDLVISANVKRRQVLMDMLPTLVRLQQIVELKAQMDITAKEGDFAKALQMCSECMLLLDSCSELTSIKEVNHSIEVWLQSTMDKVDSMLHGVCRKFQEEHFATVLDAYYVMDDVASLADKIQNLFGQIIVSETHSLVRELLNQGEEPQIAQKRNRLPYNELCLHIPEGKFRQCLCKVLESLFDMMCAYYQMLTWHPYQASSTGRLRQDSANNGACSAEGVLDGFPQVEPQGLRGIAEDDTDIPPVAETSFQQMRSDTIASIHRGLERGRKAAWELAAQRVTALLTCDAIFTTSPHHFLQSLDWVNRFIIAGEAFSGSDAISLRSKLVKLSEKYFASFHRQNLEVLRMMLDKETWQQLSPAAMKTVNLAGLTSEGALALGFSPTAILKRDTDSSIDKRSQAISEQSSHAGFGEWVKAGNPFHEKQAQLSHGSSFKKDGSGNVSADTHSLSNGASKGDVGQEDDEDDEDLLADFIDEESQLPSRVSQERRRTSSLDTRKDRPRAYESYTLTGASVSFLRYIDRYVKLMHILQPISTEVFKGLCQLFELYFLTIFKLFGQQDVLAAQSQLSASAGITARLRTTLSRILQGLDEQHAKVPEVKAASPGPSIGSEISLASSGKLGPTIMMSAGNLYGLKERFVATESIMSLATIMRNLRVRFQAMQPQDNLTSIEHFYSRTVDAVSDLREHVYRTLVKLLLNPGGYVDRIANCKWELKDLGLQHNGHVDLLLGEYKHFSSKITYGGVSKEVHELLLAYAVDAIAETLMEGLSRVKKCNNEGRALMSLDLQVLINGLQHLAPPRLSSNLQIVETYIKAFYLPETEYLHWIRTHPEYTKAQIVGLINLVASAHNWKRRNRYENPHQLSFYQCGNEESSHEYVSYKLAALCRMVQHPEIHEVLNTCLIVVNRCSSAFYSYQQCARLPALPTGNISNQTEFIHSRNQLATCKRNVVHYLSVPM